MQTKRKLCKKLLVTTVMTAMFCGCLEYVEAINVANGKSHRFKILGDPNNAISDEGYRWRNSFNFNLNGDPFNPAIWQFRGCDFLNAAGAFVGFEGNGFVNRNLWAGIPVPGNMDGIHIALSNFVQGAMAAANAIGNNIQHMAAAAVTVVVRIPVGLPNAGNLEAYTEILSDSGGLAIGLAGRPAVSIPIDHATGAPNAPECDAIMGPVVGAPQLAMYYTNVKIPAICNNASAHLLNIATSVPAFGGIGLGIPTIAFGGNNHANENYTCCEGQIVARLFDTDSPVGTESLFPQIIGDIIDRVNNLYGVPEGINDANIVLIILHIHSFNDPCAKCSKVLSGLSVLMNSVAAPGLEGIIGFTPGLLNNLANGQARFLITVSSNREYTHATGQCSEAELSGRDLNVGLVMNVTTGAPINYREIAPPANALNNLAIPNGITPNGNWTFPNTVPPYVIYGRIAAGGGVNGGIPNHIGAPPPNHGNLAQVVAPGNVE